MIGVTVAEDFRSRSGYPLDVMLPCCGQDCKSMLQACNSSLGPWDASRRARLALSKSWHACGEFLDKGETCLCENEIIHRIGLGHT